MSLSLDRSIDIFHCSMQVKSHEIRLWQVGLRKEQVEFQIILSKYLLESFYPFQQNGLLNI